MNHVQIFSKINNIKDDYKILLKDLKNHNIIKSKVNNYLKDDKESFKILWWRYIIFFLDLKKIMKLSKYRKWFILIDYNKLVLLRYLSIFYFNILVDLLKIFWKHEEFIRVFLDENFSKDYWYFAKYIYRPRFVNLINTPSIFLKSWKNKINDNIYKLLDSRKVYIKKTKRLTTDYKNIYYYIKYRTDKVIWFVSKKLSNLIAKTKFTTRKKGLITIENLNKYFKISKPWDILLTRWNWNASNLSIPWFWKHMTMYIWNWKFLKNNFSYSFLDSLNNKSEYIIEATWEWIKIVEFNELISTNDYLWVSRTSFNNEKIIRTINNSIMNFWKPYDYLFNFHSDKNLVCSELIMKSYAKEFQKDEWIEIDLDTIWISLTYPPNNFAYMLWNEWLNKIPNIYPIFFIDSLEKNQSNFISTKKEFLKSRKRPKLSLFLK